MRSPLRWGYCGRRNRSLLCWGRTRKLVTPPPVWRLNIIQNRSVPMLRPKQTFVPLLWSTSQPSNHSNSSNQGCISKQNKMLPRFYSPFLNLVSLVTEGMGLDSKWKMKSMEFSKPNLWFNFYLFFILFFNPSSFYLLAKGQQLKTTTTTTTKKERKRI